MKNGHITQKEFNRYTIMQHVYIVNKQFGSGGNLHILWGPLYPHVTYTIFHHTRAENTTFAFRSRERKWYFRPGYGEKYIYIFKTPCFKL